MKPNRSSSYQWILIPTLIVLILFSSCNKELPRESFAEDLKFLEDHSEIITLNIGESYVVVSPEFQGRVITSTSKGLSGRSYGWFNRERVKSGLGPKNNVLGGEDRMWFGPEYGPYSIYFSPGDEMVGTNVDVPAPIDREPMELVSSSETSVLMKKSTSITNYIGFTFDFDIERRVKIHSKEEVEESLDVSLGNLDYVGFEANTTITNRNESAWLRETGLLSIWDLGAFPPNPGLTVIIPLANSSQPVTQYWSEVGDDRLQIVNDVVYYKADGAYIHKIGTLPGISKDVAGSYDPATGVLTIIRYSLNPTGTYVNSQWVDGLDPYAGDAIMVFNDGKGDDGQGPFGPFYELESLSEVKELAHGESLTHSHATYHFEGNREALDLICREVLSTSLSDIESVFD